MTRRIGGETIVVPIRASAAELDSVYVFNDVGASIWDMLDKGLDTAAIATAIAAEYEVTPEAAKADLDRFLESLVGTGVVEDEER